jgi:Zn-dependent M16 (insulinase) family peptidase
MKCQQCNRPAFFRQGGVPLCIECSHKLQSILNSQFIQNAAMMNQALDQMDFVTGIPSMGGRIPVESLARAMQKAHVYNNISVTNSQVGVINTGDLAKIDAAITMTEGSDADSVGQQLKALTQAIIDSNQLTADAKKELVELIQSLSEQIVGNRKQSVSMALIKSIEERAKGINAISQLVGGLISAISRAFGGG